MPHSILVDAQRNVWTTDVGAHQVIKFTPDKGVAQIHRDSKCDHLQTATHANRYDWAKNYSQAVTIWPSASRPALSSHLTAVCSSPTATATIASFAMMRLDDFRPIGSWANREMVSSVAWVGPNCCSEAPLNLPHDIALDAMNSLLYIADRQAGRVVVATFDGQLKGVIQPTRQFDTVYALDVHAQSTALLLQLINLRITAKTVLFIPGQSPTAQAGAAIKAFAASTETRQLKYAFVPKTGVSVIEQ
jgi:hypothetical protein